MTTVLANGVFDIILDMANHALDIAGKRFGKLTVVRRAGYIDGKSTWLCKCNCGKTTVTKGAYLTRGATKSCGCIRGKNNFKHGGIKSPEYRSWSSMKTRCNNPNHERYHRYGGRGISIDKRWLDFNNFLADMGPRPPGCTLERKKNDIGYTKSNCHWATKKEQARNTCRTMRLRFRGRAVSLIELSELSGIKRTTLGQRLRLGWSVKDATSIEPRKMKGGG